MIITDSAVCFFQCCLLYRLHVLQRTGGLHQFSVDVAVQLGHPYVVSHKRHFRIFFNEFADRASYYNLSQWPTWCTNIWYMYYNPLHVRVSSDILLILRRSNCINTASGIVTVSKWPSGAQVGRELVRAISPSTCSADGHLLTVTTPDAVLIQSDLLRMSKILLETCTCREL
jgi:hypothetical protein